MVESISRECFAASASRHEWAPVLLSCCCSYSSGRLIVRVSEVAKSCYHASVSHWQNRHLSLWAGSFASSSAGTLSPVDAMEQHRVIKSSVPRGGVFAPLYTHD